MRDPGDRFSIHVAIVFIAVTSCMSSPVSAQSRRTAATPVTQPTAELTDPTPDAVTIEAPDVRPPEPTDFYDCMMESTANIGDCSLRIAAERHRLLERCFDRDAQGSQPVIIRACTFAIQNDFLEGRDRAYLFVNRADAYFRLGLMKLALADYNKAIRLSPRRATLYFNRGVYYATTGEFVRARADFDAALHFDSKLTAALRMENRLAADGH
jgi:hypothetical protein